MPGNMAFTRPGVKALLTTLRRRMWSVPSMSSIHGIGGILGRDPPAFENVALSRDAADTPSQVAMAHRSLTSSWWTGASRRIQAYASDAISP